MKKFLSFVFMLSLCLISLPVLGDMLPLPDERTTFVRNSVIFMITFMIVFLYPLLVLFSFKKLPTLGPNESPFTVGVPKHTTTICPPFFNLFSKLSIRKLLPENTCNILDFWVLWLVFWDFCRQNHSPSALVCDTRFHFNTNFSCINPRVSL